MSTDSNASDDYIYALARQVEAHPDFRVLRRLVVRDQYAAPYGGTLAKAAIIDLETTGTNIATDKIIELGIVVFEFDPETGQAYRILDTYSGLEDPEVPIPPEASAVNGITDAMVAGQRINDLKVGAMIDGVSLVIAHNAAFDRPLLEQRLPAFGALPWACSFKQIDWASAGIGSAKLEYIAYRQGFFYEGHRAVADCRALLESLQIPLAGSGTMPLRHLVQQAKEKSYRVYALGSPFDLKDDLKARGYMWMPERKLWYTTLPEDRVRDEIAWLKGSIYKRERIKLEFEALNAKTLFSRRGGTRATKEV